MSLGLFKPGGAAPRQVCQRCARAQCCCASLQQPGVPIMETVPLLILQHPREQQAFKGTARLLHQVVHNSELCVGERWDSAPGPVPPGPGGAARQDLLLYPPTPGDAQLPAPPPSPLTWPLPPGGRPPVRLVVLDATWRKSRRMLYESPWLQGLPRLSWADPPPSRFALRRARGQSQRSTFEAGLWALATLEGADVLDAQAARWAPAWAVLQHFAAGLAQQIAQGGGAAPALPPAPGVGADATPHQAAN